MLFPITCFTCQSNGESLFIFLHLSVANVFGIPFFFYLTDLSTLGSTYVLSLKRKIDSIYVYQTCFHGTCAKIRQMSFLDLDKNWLLINDGSFCHSKLHSHFYQKRPHSHWSSPTLRVLSPQTKNGKEIACMTKNCVHWWIDQGWPQHIIIGVFQIRRLWGFK